MRIKTRILHLNNQLLNGVMDVPTYQKQVEGALAPLDWQRRIQFENLTLA